MTSKRRPFVTQHVLVASRDYFGKPWSSGSIYRDIVTGGDSISYSDGRKTSGHWPWKNCVHDDPGSFSPGGMVTSVITAPWEQSAWTDVFQLLPISPSDLPGAPDIPDDMLNQTIKNCLDQINLNTSDAVLLYSGVLQAVPLLGSVTKFNQIMRGVADHVSKTLRKKPFTTVIKDLISADFIDRFVISPTLADIRKFQDATDYTLRVLDTARSRNQGIFALSNTLGETISETTTSGHYNGYGGDSAFVGYVESVKQKVTAKAFILVEATYNLSAVSPIAIWAQRTGLTRPLDSVWDLVPFSFVVDYFTRAGDFISHLSDEMSSIDGLKGKIQRIADLWQTATGSVECRREPTGIIRGPAVPGGCSLDQLLLVPDPAVSKKSLFRRWRVPDQWDRCMQLMRAPEDYLTVSLDLSQTRTRTLAELVLQAKL